MIVPIRAVLLVTVLVISSGALSASAAGPRAVHATVPAFPCPSGVAPTVVRINRPAGLNPSSFQPLKKTVRDAEAVRRLFRATCALQPATGRFNCPADFGIAYHLQFKYRAQTVLRVVAEATGCTFLYPGNSQSGQGYWVWFGTPSAGPPWMPTARKWTASLAKALGVSVKALTPQP